MINQTTLRYSFIIIIILVLLSLGFIYVFSSKIAGEKPYQVLTPEVYEKGTTVSLYKNIPPDFPKEVVLEDKILDYSGAVTSPQGKTQITVSYVTDKSMQEVVDMYLGSLPGVGWKVAEKSVYIKVSIIKAFKGTQNILMSIAPLEGRGTIVTFQYEN